MSSTPWTFRKNSTTHIRMPPSMATTTCCLNTLSRIRMSTMGRMAMIGLGSRTMDAALTRLWVVASSSTKQSPRARARLASHRK